MSEQWDGTKRLLRRQCACGADLYMEAVIDPDGPQVYIFCEKCGFRQPMIDRERRLSKADIAWATKRTRALGLGPTCSTS